MSANERPKTAVEGLDAVIREGQDLLEQVPGEGAASDEPSTREADVVQGQSAPSAETRSSSDEVERIVDEFIREAGACLEMLPEEHAQSVIGDIPHQDSAVSQLIRSRVSTDAHAHTPSAHAPAVADGDVIEEAERLLSGQDQTSSGSGQGNAGDAKRVELERRVQEQAAELEALRKKLEEMPLVKVTETVAESGQSEVRYEFSRVPLETAEAQHARAEAEKAKKRAEEAERAADAARREAAEEVFRLEAAKAEVRLEAFRVQQRLLKERKAREARQAAGQGLTEAKKKTPAVREGWVKVKRGGAVGGWEERFLVARAEALALYQDEEGAGPCLNVLGLEEVQRAGRVGSGPLMEVVHGAGAMVVDCGGLDARERWVMALEQALARFRTTYVAQPPQKRRAIEEVERAAWDSASEERTRREIQQQRQAVLEAERKRDAAERALDRARAVHIETDRELRLRIKFPDITTEFVGTLPPTQARDSGGLGQNAAGMVDLAEVEKAVGAARETAKKEASKAIKETTQAFQAKVAALEKSKAEAEQELQMYKEMAFRDAEKRAAEEARRNLSSRDRAREDAAGFDAKLYKDGMLIVPDGWGFEDVPGLSNLPSPSGKVKRDNVTVFTDGPQAVVLQGLNVAAFSTDDRSEDTERAPKMGPAEAERAYH